MRFIQAVLLLIFLGAIGLFAARNTGPITVDFAKWRITGPVALMAIVAYPLGMLDGWTVVSHLSRSIRRVSRRPSEE